MDYTIEQYKQEMNEHYYRDGTYHTMRDPDNNTTSGNHHVINSTHYAILSKFNVVDTSDREQAQVYIERTKTANGLFNRSPTKLERNAHDDLVAISCTSKLLGLPYAGSINDKGEYSNPIPYYYNNTGDHHPFEFRFWFGRFLWTVFTFRACANKDPGLFYKLAFSFYLLSDLNEKDLTNTSGRLLKWIQVQAVKGQYWLVDKAISIWEKDISKKYPGKVGDIMGIYHGVNHPFSKLMKDKL